MVERESKSKAEVLRQLTVPDIDMLNKQDNEAELPSRNGHWRPSWS